MIFVQTVIFSQFHSESFDKPSHLNAHMMMKNKSPTTRTNILTSKLEQRKDEAESKIRLKLFLYTKRSVVKQLLL